LKIVRFAVLGLLWAFATNPAGAQGIKTKHVIEFRLAEDEARPGLVAVRVAGEARIIYLHAEVVLDDGDIRTASVVKGPYGEPAVQLHLKPSGVKKFNAMAESKRNSLMAVIVRGLVIETPVVQGPMFDDRLDIVGELTGDQASALARALSKAK
jgi:preprotein translocase subunit SecD